jgi:hypothetical protein
MAAIMLCSGALALCGREKQLLPINVKNGICVKVDWLVTKKQTKIPLIPNVRN